MSLSTDIPVDLEEQQHCAAIALRTWEHVNRFKHHDDAGMSELWGHIAGLDAGKDEGAPFLAMVSLYCLNRLGRTANSRELEPAVRMLTEIAAQDPQPSVSEKEVSTALGQVKTAADTTVGRWLQLYAREVAVIAQAERSPTPLHDRIRRRRYLDAYALQSYEVPEVVDLEMPPDMGGPGGAITYTDAAQEPNTPLP